MGGGREGEREKGRGWGEGGEGRRGMEEEKEEEVERCQKRQIEGKALMEARNKRDKRKERSPYGAKMAHTPWTCHPRPFLPALPSTRPPPPPSPGCHRLVHVYYRQCRCLFTDGDCWRDAGGVGGPGTQSLQTRPYDGRDARRP